MTSTNESQLIDRLIERAAELGYTLRVFDEDGAEWCDEPGYDVRSAILGFDPVYVRVGAVVILLMLASLLFVGRNGRRVQIAGIRLRLPDTLTSDTRQHGHIVDIHQRLSLEGGIALKAIDQPDWLAIQPGNEAGRTGTCGQAVTQACLDVFGQRVATAHRVASVGIEQHHQGCAVRQVPVIHG